MGKEGALSAVGDILVRVPRQVPSPHVFSFLKKSCLLSSSDSSSNKEAILKGASRLSMTWTVYTVVLSWLSMAWTVPQPCSSQRRVPTELEGISVTSDPEHCSALQSGWMDRFFTQ